MFDPLLPHEDREAFTVWFTLNSATASLLSLHVGFLANTEWVSDAIAS